MNQKVKNGNAKVHVYRNSLDCLLIVSSHTHARTRTHTHAHTHTHTHTHLADCEDGRTYCSLSGLPPSLSQTWAVEHHCILTLLLLLLLLLFC